MALSLTGSLTNKNDIQSIEDIIIFIYYVYAVWRE